MTADHAPDWRFDALCAEVGVELFFPEQGASPRLAKSICDSCPVAAQCLEFALADPEIEGIWGGTTTRERARMRGARRAGRQPIKHGTLGGYRAHHRRKIRVCDDCRAAEARYRAEYRKAS